jgi:mannose-6-phosphate isomerase-like protein (cupin superfamily)
MKFIYIVAGHGEMKMNNETFQVQAGDCPFLPGPGNWHGLKTDR